MSDVETTEKPARKKRAPAKPKQAVETHYGKKTLIAAVTAAIFALLDLYMNVRHGINLPF